MKKLFLPLLLAFAAIGAIGIYFTNILMFMKKKEDELIKTREMKAKRWIAEEFDKLPKTSVTVDSPFGYSLDCLFVAPHKSNKWMIFCHGITENKYNSIKYMNLFLKKGFNAVLYDHRRHGASGGKSSSYGYYEKWDLEAIINELKKRQGKDVYFGIHGESMGAVTALLYGGSVKDDAAFYVADCPFSTLRAQVLYRLREETPLPSWFVMPIGNAFLKIRDGYCFQDVSPIDAVRQIVHPVMFIHSKLDAFIPASMTQALYEAKPGKKQLWLAEKGGHAQSFNENQEEYETYIDQFLEYMETSTDT